MKLNLVSAMAGSESIMAGLNWYHLHGVLSMDRVFSSISEQHFAEIVYFIFQTPLFWAEMIAKWRVCSVERNCLSLLTPTLRLRTEFLRYRYAIFAQIPQPSASLRGGICFKIAPLSLRNSILRLRLGGQSVETIYALGHAFLSNKVHHCCAQASCITVVKVENNITQNSYQWSKL